MFRAIVKSRTDLQGPQIADFPILEATISEDKTQKATSNFTVINFSDEIQNGDIIGVYDGTGKFYYWGVITSKGEDIETRYHSGIRVRKIECSQFDSIYDDEQLLVAQTSANQKAFYNRHSVSEIIDFYLTSKELGFLTIANTMSATFSPVFSGYSDIGLKNMYKGIIHEVIDDPIDSATADDRIYDHVPYPLEKNTINLEDFLHESFENYRRIIRPYIVSVPNVPSEYQPVLYIESDGTGQYIDTGISPSSYLNTLRIELDAQFTDLELASTYTGLLSSGYYNQTATSRRNILIGLRNDGTFRILNGAQASTGISMGAADNKRHLFVIDQIGKYYKLNNYSSFTTTVNASLVKNIILFAYINADTSGAPISYYCPGRIYRCRILNNNIPIRDFIPCFRKSDSTVGLYDAIEGVFYSNAGSTGSFIAANRSFDKSIHVAIFNPNKTIPYDYGNREWDYREKILFDSWEQISDVNITDEDVETNTLAIYDANGSTLRGVFTVLKDGTIQQMEAGVEYADRYGAGKTAYVFDATNAIKDLAQANIPASQFNHKIEFSISFNKEYSFEDFNLGQPIKFYSKARPGKVYESALTAWSYSINQNSEKITNAKFTLGNARNNLTSKINLIVKKKKK